MESLAKTAECYAYHQAKAWCGGILTRCFSFAARREAYAVYAVYADPDRVSKGKRAAVESQATLGLGELL